MNELRASPTIAHRQHSLNTAGTVQGNPLNHVALIMAGSGRKLNADALDRLLAVEAPNLLLLGRKSLLRTCLGLRGSIRHWGRNDQF